MKVWKMDEYSVVRLGKNPIPLVNFVVNLKVPLYTSAETHAEACANMRFKIAEDSRVRLKDLEIDPNDVTPVE